VLAAHVPHPSKRIAVPTAKRRESYNVGRRQNLIQIKDCLIVPEMLRRGKHLMVQLGFLSGRHETKCPFFDFYQCRQPPKRERRSETKKKRLGS